MEPRFTVEFMQEAADFLDGIEPKARAKIYYNIVKSQSVNDSELFKKLNQEIWEFRTLYSGKCYRLFAFWVKGKESRALVIATHGIIKKSSKTPLSDLEHALFLKRKFESDLR